MTATEKRSEPEMNFRLSPQQRRLWQLQSRLGERPFRASALARIRGRLDLGLLQEAVAEVASRFEILRTTFPCPAGLVLPLQRVAEEAGVAWLTARDLSGLAVADRETALDDLLRSLEEEPFDFARGPLLRLAPAVLSADEHALALVLPSLCADAVTLRNLVRQIAARYALLSGTAPDPEDSAPLQYADLAEWQNELLEGEETSAGREHWEAWDPTVCRALRLPFETGRAEGDRFEPLSLAVPLESGLAQCAAALASELEAPLSTLFLAAWQSLLWRLLGQPEIVVGWGAECRSYEGLSESLGPLASFVPLSCNFDGDLRFADAVTRARDAEQAAAEWQEYFRWESLAERHGLPLEETVFPVSFTAEEQPAPWHAGPLEWELPRSEAGIDRFRLGLSVRLEDGLPAVSLSWDAALFSREDAQGLAHAWRALLASAVAQPEAPIGELALVGPDEPQPVPAGTTAAPLVHELFARQAQRVPDRAAVVSHGESLTYAELAERARQLSLWLRRHGVGPDEVVALCLERSLSMPLAVLGILGAGGAYLPLEPGLPRERKSFLLADARPRAVLTETRFLAGLPAAGMPVLCLDTPWQEEVPEGEPEGAAPDPANLVYVIYTSGSTGTPKGVAVEHRQLANYVRGVAERLDLPDGAAYAMVSTFAADLGNTVLFPSLCGGGTLHLIPDELTSDPAALAAALERDPVDCLKITPGHLEALLAGAPGARLLPRRCLVLGGEASRSAWVEGLAALKPGLRVLNHYGPTETTVGVLTHPAGPGLRTATLPLGRSLPGTTAWLLGADLTPLPAWFPGELYLGGAGVARGYLGRPDLTAERFGPDPLAGVPGARMYRTGDLARRLPDGTFEFIGRADDQVKIRGFRIELGEVETVLEADPEVRRAAAAARGDGSGPRRLVAYVVPESGTAASASALRERLRERLPEFMVPSAFVFLDALPRNANGKVDRRALPDPDWRHLGAAEELVVPEGRTEEVLAQVWSEVLGVDRVGAHDNFFHLGGDSIRGIVARARAEEQGVAFSIEQLFDHPVLRDLARVAGEGEPAATAPGGTEPFSLLSAADRARLPEGIEDAYPLSSLQAGMLFHSEAGEGTAIFHDLHSLHVRAPFAPEPMREAVLRASRLHPLLRTSFDLVRFSESLQLVHAGVVAPLEIHDLRALTPEEREAAVAGWLREERRRAFDWTRPSLVSFHVHLRDEESFQFTLSFHHAVLDGWSSASLLTGLFRTYTALLRGDAPAPEPPLAATYRDFVALERAALSSPEARSFWSRRLDGAEPARLPRLSPPETGPGAEAEVRRIRLPIDPALSDGAHRAARDSGVPLKSLLLGAQLKALAVLGGTSDVLTALIAHGRPEQADGERILGLFLNALPLRLRLPGGSWRDLAREVFDLERRMLPFRRFPFAEMQRMEGGRLALEVTFNYLHYHVYQEAASSREIEILGNQDYEETNFPVVAHVSLHPLSQQLQIGLNYRTSELAAGDVERLGQYLLRALAAFVADPAARHDAAVLLSAAELAQVLGDGAVSPLPVAPLHRLFERQASRTPEAIALTDGDRRMSYGELEAAANRLARRLRALGIGPEARVAVLLERSTDLVVTLLAVLKAGGAYVPIDPAYPPERIAFLLADSAPSALVTEGTLSVDPSLQTVRLDEERERIAALPGHALAGPDEPASLAYVIYTSGSTGRPKGVQVTHANAARLFAATEELFGFGPGDVWTFFHSAAFDFSVWEIWGALLYGGRLVVVPQRVTRSPEDFHALLAAEGVTVLNQTPSAFQQLAAWEPETDAARELALRLVIFGGEALNLASLRPWFERHGDERPRLVNMYGITETTVHVTFRPVSAADLDLGSSPIGGPIADLRLYLLAADGTLVPPGVPGEIHVGGAGLARGYLGRPELTAERFLPDPFGGGAGERLYRSGDLARRRPDGDLDYLGRIDHQVKIRGFRIELGEIEAALVDQPGVKEAVVVARPDGSSSRLVAYVVPAEGAEASPASLREALLARLPAYMVPAAWKVLPALPLTASGKVDRRALPEPEAPAGGPVHAEPRTPVEQTLAALWAEVLRIEKVGLRDNFFDLGGHSLLTTRLIARVRGAFEIDLPLSALFDTPVLEDFAAGVETALRSGAGLTIPPLAPAPREAALPLSLAQQRLWFLDQLEPGSPAYNIPAAVLLRGDLDRAALAAGFEGVVARHEILRTTFDSSGEEPRQRIAPPAAVPLPLIDLSALPEARRKAEARTLARAEARRPFDLRRGPLLRVTLLCRGAAEHALLLTLHHIVADGWSMDLLIREVAALYSSAPLPPLPVQYADFAIWQRRWMTPEVLESQLHYWRRQLEGAPLVLELPADRPRPAVPSGRGRRTALQVPAPQAAALAALARREGVTLFMALAAAFGALLHRATGSADLLVGTDMANRDRVETESLIGFFINQLVLRIRAGGDPSFLRLLLRVREMALGAYAHKDLPFERLVEDLQPERDLSRHPVFQVSFALKNAPEAAAELPGLSLRPFQTGGGAAKLDLLLMAGEAPGGGLSLETEHSVDLYDDTTAARWLRHLEILITGAAADPERPVADLPLLPASERQQVLVEWNDSPARFPGETFPQLFAERAAAVPSAVAALCEEKSVTYGELDRQAGRLARALVRRGVGPDSVIPLLAARSLDFLAAVLGVFEAGRAYLPLDPQHPGRRWAQLLGACSAGLVLCERDLAARLAAAIAEMPAPRPGLLILEDLLAAPESAGSPPPGLAAPGQLAYAIYTSGSTGVPKGAMIEHRGMLNHLWAKVAALGLTAEDTVAQTASQCFDISVWQLLAPLLVGGRVRIYPDEVAHDPLRLISRADADGVTVLETVPSLLRLMIEELAARPDRPQLDRLRWMIPTGEALPPDLCREWLRLHPAVPLLNAYGPTECSDDVTHHTIAAAPEAGEVRIPIGRPVPNLRLHVLDRGLRPQPVGVPGELFVGGSGVGRGYLREAARTAEAWWPDPFSDRPGARLYRTGDLARLRADGALEFLGRIDHQVKLSGHRIELGEIEAVLARHPKVSGAALSVREDTPGDRRLVAYVVPQAADPGAAWDSTQVDGWRQVFDEVYVEGPRSARDAGVNLRVWVSSYDGNPLPEEEIFECLEDSVARLLALLPDLPRPPRVLEIGCGTGLLLLRIAPHCESYWATDVSPAVIRSLEERIAARGDLPGVRLLAQAADDFADLPEEGFDLVIVNEVVQYFPSVEYLVRVLDGAVAAVADGGRLFVGGVRSFPLLEAFHASVELHQAGDLPPSELRERTRRRLAQDKELAVDPELFEALARQPGGRVREAAIQLKGGRSHNELTRFRYDAVLRIGGPAVREADAARVDWSGLGGLDELRRVLESAGSELLIVRGIPNARLVPDGGVEPQDLWSLGAALGWPVEVRWQEGGADGLLEAWFSRHGACPRRTAAAGFMDTAWKRWANRPLRGVPASEGLVPGLRAYLAERLPEPMLPSAFVLLDALPLTRNGKLDRRALPAPDAGRSRRTVTAPRGPVEEALAAIWAEVLGLERVGIDDNFFELGGHSLLATRVVSRVRGAFALDFPLNALFDSPTVAGMAAAVEAALRGGAHLAAPPLVPVPRGGDLPLSFAQQRLWFLDQLVPDNPFYNIPVHLRAKGTLSVPVLAASLNRVVERHEALRTTFPAEAGSPVQKIAPRLRLGLPMIDLAALPPALRETEAARIAREEARQPFDLAAGPLLRARLVRFDDRDHLALATLHHIVSDGWSSGIFNAELGEVYAALSEGRPPRLSELPVQYPDYAAWQRGWLEGEVLAAEIAWWRERLGDPPTLGLPTDRPRPAVSTFRGSWRPLQIPAVLTAALRDLGRRQSATLYMVLLSAFDTLLFRYTGQTDLLVGAPIANRNRAEIEGLIGFFVNTLAFRMDLSGRPSFSTLLGRVRETALGAYVHQDLPFEKLIEELHPERDTSRNPLFQVVFVLQNFPLPQVALPGLTLEPAAVGSGTAKFDLTLFLFENGDGIGAHLEYSTDLFEPATVDRMLHHYQALLEGVAADPEAGLGELPLLSPPERHQLLTEWSAPAGAEPPRETSIHALFEEQADLFPGHVALAFGDREVTYAELDREANRLAHHLLSLGVTPETRVGLSVERSPELIVGLLGILKAGAAYVPLDPDLPRERLAFLIEDVATPVLVTEEPLAERLPAPGATIVRLDADAAVIAAASAERPNVPAALDQLAYVMYTSGSTGRPKGVAVPHRGVIRLVRGHFIGFGPGEVFLQLAPVSFDASTLEIWGALLHGARLALFEPRHVSLEELGEAVARHRVSTLWLTAGLFHQMTEGHLEGLRPVRQLLAGGDVLAPAQVRRALAELGCTLVNGYGPTENTTFTCCHPMAHPGEVKAPVPIGRPIEGTRVHLLDPELRPVPAGVPGELYAGGDGLARGYLNRPDLTAERFLPDPESGRPGERLYRTGDLARWLPDGRVEFLGRLDQQVKIRGFRIEPGEVETVLAAHPAVREAAVVVRRGGAGEAEEARLVAYVVQEPEAETLPEAQGEWRSEQVEHWRELFDSTYEREAADPTFDITGWNSSYDGRPLPAEEMREWVQGTVGRIAAERPRRVLEIGCGTGLLLFRIAAQTESYRATDFSDVALDRLQSRLVGRDLPQVRLERRTAEDFSGVGAGELDAVVLNSVAQYFPSVDYLLSVLSGAVERLAPGGFLFLGDLRSFSLLEAFHTSIELARAGGSLPSAQLRQRVLRGMAREEELLIDPALFLALRERFPQLGQVRVQLRRGQGHNELTRFRYDVLLRARPAVPAPEALRLDWQRRGLSLPALRELLARDEPEVLELTGVPNARLAETPAVDPEDLWALEEAFPYTVLVAASPEDPLRMDVRLVHERAPQGARDASFPQPGAAPRPWGSYANNPLAGRFAQRLVPLLRGFLEERLPDSMVPSAFVLLDALPLTPNGKLDRRALPEPDLGRPSVAAGYAPPSGPIEPALAAIWEQVLGVERVGRHDDFFELGGHSLLATQVASRVREALRVALPVRQLFEHPTVADLAREIEALRAAESGPEPPPILPVPRGGRLPLSFGQQRLWFLDQLQPGNIAYNMPAAVRLHGPLVPAALAAAVGGVVARHEALRTTFEAIDGQPVQVISPPAPVPFPVADLSGLPEEPRRAEARRLAVEAARHPFDLARGPLLRALLLRLGADDHGLVFCLHHIVSDGWSTGLLMREVAALYPAALAGRPSPLAPLPIQYADFAHWQRGWMSGEVLQSQISWWREQLSGAPPVLDLPTDHPRPEIATVRGRIVQRTLPAGLSAAVQSLGRRAGTTPFMTLLGMFGALLSRYCRQPDLLVASPIAGRHRVEVEGLIGFFVNTLPLCVRLADDPPVSALLAAVRETTLSAYAHQDLPFESLVEELRLPRDLSRNPLCQAMFAFQNFPTAVEQIPGLAVSSLDDRNAADTGTAQLDLALYLWDEGGRLHASLEINAGLFEAATGERLLNHFETLLAGATADPQTRASGLPVLTPAERRQLAAWNETGAAEPLDAVHRLVRAQAERVALSFGGERLTYGELAQRARRLARRLRSLGVGPEVLVGVALERSPELLVAVLGTLEAGGAYLPLDPAYPAERLAYMLADSGARVLLTQPHLAGALPAHGAQVVCLERGWTGEAGDDGPLEDGLADPGQLAYTIYTSGSTGRPKGVEVPHRALANFLEAMRRAPGLGADDVLLAVTSLSFDIAGLELFLPLLVGARIEMASATDAADGQRLLSRLHASGATVLQATPSTWRMLLEAGWEEPGGLRLALCGGEALQGDLAQSLLRRAGEVWNVYGPTETTVWSTAGRLRATERVTIGRPILDTTVHLLDPWGTPVPAGVPGSLRIGGAGVARGYAGRPELTAERFRPDPFALVPGARLYDTGDLARFLPDGRLDFLGRTDHQVKVHGFRIELGEVEAALLALPAVERAAAGVHGTGADRRLTAWVVPAPGAEVTLAGLRNALRERLPGSMIPTALVVLDRMPLTPNGKLDRRALPAPDGARPRRDAGFVAPRNPVEQALAEIWGGVLRLDRVGVHDDFFDLGGHSLTATQVQARLRRQLRVDLPLRRLFERPTIAGLAELLLEEREKALATELAEMSDEEIEALWLAEQQAGAGEPTR